MNEAFFTQLPLYAALTHLGFIVGLLVSRRRSAVTRTFALSNAGFLVWNFFAFVYLSNEEPLAERLSLLGLIFIPPFLYQFFIYFLDEHGAKARWQLRVFYWVSAAGLAALPFDFGNADWWKLFVSVYVLVVVGLLLKRMWDKSLETDSWMERRDLRILLVLGAAAALLGLTNFLAFYFPLITLGSLGGILYTLSFAAAIIRRRLLSLMEILQHALVPLLLTAGFALLYILLWISTKTGPSFHIIHVLFVVFILLLLYRPMQILLQELMDHLFLGEGYNFQQSLVGFSRRILSRFNVLEILSLFKDTLERFPKIGNLSVFLKDANQSHFTAVPFGPGPDLRRVSEQEDLIKALESYHEYLIAEELRRELKMALPRQYREGIGRTLKKMEDLHADLVFPLFSGRELMGFFSLSLKDKSLELHSQELGLIRAAANQVAIALDNARIYEEMALKDRLASLGEMSAGLAHEIRGPLGAIKGAAQYLRSDVKPEETAEFLQVIVEESIYNPLGNEKDIILMRAAWQLTVGQVAITETGLMVGYNAAAGGPGLTLTTELALTGTIGAVASLYVGTQIRNPSARVSESVTFIAPGPYLCAHFGGAFTAGTLGAGAAPYIDLGGAVRLAPGAYAAIYTLTSTTGMGYFWWMEVPRRAGAGT